jgi:hypothetical protein
MSTPAAGRIDSNHACLHDRSAPIGNLLRFTTDKVSGIGTIPESNSMKPLAQATHINAHGVKATGL